MGLRINGRSPVEFRYNGRALSGLALGNKIVWRRDADTNTISVGINPTDVAKVKDIECTGDVLGKTVTATKDFYTFTVSKGGTATIKVVPETGYQVSKLNVDTVSQGSVDVYDFTIIQKNHTMYIWMEIEVEEVPIDFLVRSDKPDVYYSSTHIALNAIKADYPEGLTQDVTLSCVKPATEYRLANDPNKARNEFILLAVLKEWNQGSLYTLVLDGSDKLTYNGNGLGGLQFRSVDNIIIRNIKFVNCTNYVGVYTPDEIAGLMFVGSEAHFARNLSIWDCTFEGLSTTDKTTCSTFAVSTKYTENVYVQGCEFKNNGGLAFKMSNSRLAAFVKNKFDGKSGSASGSVTVAHPGFFDITNGHKLIIEDNDIDGTTYRESLMYLSNIDNIELRRNYIHGGARIIEMMSNTSIKKLVIESNLLVGCMVNPQYSWISEYITSSSDIIQFVFNNNTMWMSGSNWQQFILRFNQIDIRSAEIFNNIVVDPSPVIVNKTTKGFLFKTLGSLSMGHNLFKLSIRDADKQQTYETLLSVSNEANSPDSITISGGNAYLLSYLQTQQYDTASKLVNKNIQLLDIEAGGVTYAITPNFDTQYLADNDKVSEIDYLYRTKSIDTNSLGCYNLHGIPIDENTDTLTGYIGEDFSEKNIFNSSLQYTTMADSVLVLTHNTRNRKRIIKWFVEGSQHKSLAIGKHALVHTLPAIDSNGVYLSDELYTIKID